jgi:hypothetical protein
MNFNQEKPEKSLQTVIEKCWKDETFKQEFLENPVKIMEKLSGQTMNLEGRKVIAVDQTDSSTVYINIPADPNDVVLTDAELEVVAGGVESRECSVWSWVVVVR